MNDKKQNVGAVKIHVEQVQKKLGSELFGKVIVLLSTLNKLYALWDLIDLSDQFYRKKTTARSDRNRCAAAILLVGILHELRDVLESIGNYVKKGGLVHNKIKNLNKIFHDDDFRNWLTNYRDFLSVHWGKKFLSIDLVELVTKKNNFMKYDSNMKRDIYFKFADNVINRAFFKKKYDDLIDNGILQDKKFDDFFVEKQEEFYDYIFRVHTYVLKQAEQLIVCIIDEFQLTVDEK